MLLGHVVTLYLFLEHGVSREYGVPRHFDLNGEGNFASWFESFPLLVAAMVTFLLASHYRDSGAPLAHRWAALSGVLLLMSIDEASQLHDLFTGPLRRGLAIDFGVFYFAWLIPAVAFLVLAAWYFAPVIRSLPASTQLRLIAAAGIYFGGAIVVEMLSGFAVENGRKSTPYLTVLTFEEACEISGILLAVGTLLRLLHTVQPRSTIELLGAGGGTVGVAPAATAPAEPR